MKFIKWLMRVFEDRINLEKVIGQGEEEGNACTSWKITE